jgi:hypothetical protein
MTKEKKEIQMEYGDNSISKATKLEQRAEDLRRRPGPGEKIGQAYEEAGDLRRQAGDIFGANNDYRDAKVYGYSNNEKELKRMDDKINQLRFEKEGRLAKRFAIISMATLTIALLFVSSSLTGFSILNVSSESSRLISSCFFVCGLIFTFVYLKAKKR